MRAKLFLVLIIATACFAQSTSPEPDIADIFYFVDGAKLTSLERQRSWIHRDEHKIQLRICWEQIFNKAEEWRAIGVYCQIDYSTVCY